MKRALLSLCLAWSSLSGAQAHPQPPITRYVQSSPTVCVAQVTKVEGGLITFTVEEVIKGAPPVVLKLNMTEVPVPITINSEWLLAATSTKENTVGWAIAGDFGWVNAPMKRVNGEIQLAGSYGYPNGSLATDSSFKALTIDQLRALAKEPLPKH